MRRRRLNVVSGIMIECLDTTHLRAEEGRRRVGGPLQVGKPRRRVRRGSRHAAHAAGSRRVARVKVAEHMALQLLEGSTRRQRLTLVPPQVGKDVELAPSIAERAGAGHAAEPVAPLDLIVDRSPPATIRALVHILGRLHIQ